MLIIRLFARCNGTENRQRTVSQDARRVGPFVIVLISVWRVTAWFAHEWGSRSSGSWPPSAEQRLKELGIELPPPPEPFGIYVEAVQTGNQLFLTGMLPTAGREAKFTGRVGAELDTETGRKAAHLAALNVLAVAREHLGSLDKVTRIVRLADAASELLQDVFGKEKNPSRLVYGVASLPLGAPVVLEVIFEVGE